jgi:hypothetical protein
MMMTMMGDENDDDSVSMRTYSPKGNANPDPGKQTTRLLLRAVIGN